MAEIVLAAVVFPDEDVLAVRRQIVRAMAVVLHERGFSDPLRMAERILAVRWAVLVGRLTDALPKEAA